ncbi:MAG TPA: ankyrin repeat domain-containing protein, partial [Emcibacteraceae bacterium]|nr:ankyrin repeat domain-containing protein [Emcibacteraceae bacterium]
LKKQISSILLMFIITTIPVASSVLAQQGGMSDSYKLLKSVKDKNYSELRNYLQKGTNVNTRDYNDGETPLYLATLEKDKVMVTFLLASNANTDLSVKSTGETPLMVAVRLRAHEILKMLISQNADLNIKDKNGETALYKAVQLNDRTSVKELLDAKADWALADNTGRTPYDLTLENRRLRSIQGMLEEAGAEY